MTPVCAPSDASLQRSSSDRSPTSDGTATAAATPFSAFFARVRGNGLSVVREYQPDALLAYASQALVLEEKVMTGCFLIQAVALVDYWRQTTGLVPIQHVKQARKFGTRDATHMHHDAWLCPHAVRLCMVCVSPQCVGSTSSVRSRSCRSIARRRSAGEPSLR